MADGNEIKITHPAAVAWGEPDNPRVLTAISGLECYGVEVALITAIVEAVPPPSASEGGH